MPIKVGVAFRRLSMGTRALVLVGAVLERLEGGGEA
jgi:hypothetical protein